MADSISPRREFKSAFYLGFVTMAEVIGSVLSELRAESMRAATLVGLASVPLGFLWIYVFGTNAPGFMLLAGVSVGVLYSDRPTPSHRAGARAGIFVPIPEVIVQVSVAIPPLWESSAGLATRLATVVLFSLLGLLAIWVVGAIFCVVSAAVTAWIVEYLRSIFPRSASVEGQ